MSDRYGVTYPTDLASATRELSGLRKENDLLRTALNVLCNEIIATKEHGDGADDPQCQLCFAIRQAQKLL
jgi:hypothetical protein